MIIHAWTCMSIHGTTSPLRQSPIFFSSHTLSYIVSFLFSLFLINRKIWKDMQLGIFFEISYTVRERVFHPSNTTRDNKCVILWVHITQILKFRALQMACHSTRPCHHEDNLSARMESKYCENNLMYPSIFGMDREYFHHHQWANVCCSVRTRW